MRVLLLENIQVSEAYWDADRQKMVYRVEFTADRTSPDSEDFVARRGE